MFTSPKDANVGSPIPLFTPKPAFDLEYDE